MIKPPVSTRGRMLATSMPQPRAAPRPNSRAPAGTEDQAHVVNWPALAIQCAPHCAVTDDQQKEQNAAFDELAPHSARQAVGRVNRNDLGKVKVDSGEDDVAKRAHSIDSS